MKKLQEQIKFISNTIEDLKKKAKIVIANGHLELQIKYHESILKTLKIVETKQSTVIKSFAIPLTVQVLLKIPKGKILGVSKQTFQKKDGRIEEKLYLSVLYDSSNDTIERMLYVIPDGTPMQKITSLGKFYGTFSVSGSLVHVFDKIYHE